MARKRKPCEFCEQEAIDTIELPNAHAQIQIYPDNCLFEMNWCPVCGRKVGY